MSKIRMERRNIQNCSKGNLPIDDNREFLPT